MLNNINRPWRYNTIVIAFLLFLVLVFVILLLWNQYRLVPYIPVTLTVERGDHVLRYDNSIMNQKHKDNICKILSEYGEYHKKQGDTILIHNYLFRDMDTLQNYTNKAEALSFQIGDGK